MFPVGFYIFGAGDSAGILNWFSLQTPLLKQISELSSVATNKQVAAAIQLDGTTAQGFRDVLFPPGERLRGRYYHPMSETNTGDPKTLLEFASWAYGTCPADTVVLVLSGHGLAWRDSAVTFRTRGEILDLAGRHASRIFLKLGDVGTRAVLVDGQSRDFLSNQELGEAVKGINQILSKKLSVLVFDACLMSSVEILGELDDKVKVVVGCIDELSSAGLNLAEAARSITRTSSSLPIDVGKQIVNTFAPVMNHDTAIAIDLAGEDWTKGKEAFSEFVRLARVWLLAGGAPARSTWIESLRSATRLIKYRDANLCDIGALCDSIINNPSINNAEIKALAVKSVDFFTKSVVAAQAAPNYKNAVGMSIFAPADAESFRPTITDYGKLRFPAATGWHDLLRTTFEIT